MATERSVKHEAKHLKAVAKGGAVVVAGRLTGKFLRFLLVAVTVRLITKADFGAISLAYVILNIVSVFATLGFGSGLPRYIARFRAQGGGENSEIGQLIASSSLFILGSAVILSIGVYLTAARISLVFGKPELEGLLRMFAFLLLPLVGIRQVSAIFQGLEVALPRFVFQDVIIYVARLGLVVPLFFLDERFEPVVWSYVFSAWITAALALVYSHRRLRDYYPLRPDLNLFMEVLRFSLPLLAVSLVLKSSTWIGTILVGYWAPTADVASFTVALRLAEVLTIGITAVAFIFMPMATRAATVGDHDGVARLYGSITKWASMFSLPLLLFFALDASYVIHALFSAEYVDAAPVLKMLTVGYLIHIVFGLNGSALLAHGRSKTVFYGSGLYGASTVVTALLLAPGLGSLGVAVALSAGLCVLNVFMSVSLYRGYGISPLSGKNYLPITALLISGYLTTRVLLDWAGESPVMHLSVLFAVYLLALLCLLFTRSLDSSDVELLRAMEKRLTGRVRLANRLSENLR